jgi:hypothetical protein
VPVCCGCCEKKQLCCPASPAPKKSSAPKREGPPERCWMCDRPATKPKPSAEIDGDAAWVAPAFPPVLEVTFTSEEVPASDERDILSPPLRLLNCVWTC